MKHLIKDAELVSYLEGYLTKDEVKSLKKRIEENGELDMLYHLQLSYDEGMKDYANSLLGEDNFVVDTESTGMKSSETYGIAADKIIPKKMTDCCSNL